MRSEVASREYSNYLEVISKNHSILVMDREVKRFFFKIKPNGIILDIGVGIGEIFQWKDRM
ncbi:hypothetical protein FH593_12950 [Leptospira interrogans]|uniref:Methyltransferase n=2 Tax=Leptospira interrogans TaxID=173 RepID=Q8F5N1_LEPIN|nr:hypothetical protein [Leptospira interrogans]EMN62300.1 hypothetical protein LEP1GSC092_0237 [Leptospira interrogans serovar Pyrogenes str. R168]MBE0305513.1 hypothetical protein [Leptospira interrogans serovar Yeoncheon]QOI43065.1 hypothetical protein Lepto782_12880 [Leptospira interrogans serovar Canicola]AAN48835.1 hypothetical protein LA_1636 [Leptospira interrogans serovar Lai str. 56601]AER02121.1 hypothetical protein LIF_A1322 [Leptospira interrogans serovar Lai str. IPAV]